MLAPATLAALPSTRAIETRSLPSSLAATHRGFAFYVAFPESSIPSLATCSMSRVPRAPFFSLSSGTAFDVTIQRFTFAVASLSKSSAEVCARLHRDGARNPAKYSRRMDTPPDSPTAGGNANAYTSRAKARDSSGQLARTGPSKLAPFPGAKRPREIQSEAEKPHGNARRVAARN